MFLKFKDGSSRDEFMDELSRRRPDLAGDVRAAKSQDRIVTVTTADEVRCRQIEELAGPRAERFGDVQFQPLPEESGEG